MAESGRAVRYEKISDLQRSILLKFYRQGMTNTAKGMDGLIEEAAKETELEVDKVKSEKWTTAYEGSSTRAIFVAVEGEGGTSSLPCPFLIRDV
eukprot:gene15005-6159_t